ncbi:hypothetical protein M3Y99_01583200 [Aphelenchoides fujianensis]|nr:hypothetical protein M3Y99_01583200 [Aphelenchoides fujianensis]
MAFAVALVCWALVAFGAFWLWKHLQLRKSLAGLPSPRSFPVLGHALIVKPDIEGFVDQLMAMALLYPRSPRACLFWNGPSPVLMIYEARLVDTIFTNSAHLNKGMLYDMLKPWLGEGLLTRCSSMGQTVQAQVETESEYVRAVLRINDIIQNRQKNPLVYPELFFNLFGEGKEQKWAVNVLHTFSQKVIRERRATFDADLGHPNERPAFLDLLLELERQGLLDEKSIQEEVSTFMFEGHDTTATGVTWAMHVLGCHPEVQQKVYEEIQRVCGDSEDVTIDHLSQLKYVECCIKETLRLYPSVPIIARRLGNPIDIAGTRVPAGVETLLNLYLIHRDPAYWEDPEVFDPDRFLPENAAGRHAFAYLPFSAGSRNCIGQRFAMMEEKIMIVGLIRAFHIESVRRRDEQACRTELILRPKGGVAVRLTPRTPAAS